MILRSDPTFWSDFALSLHHLLHRAIAGATRSSPLGTGAANEERCVGHRLVSFCATYRAPVARYADVLSSQSAWFALCRIAVKKGSTRGHSLKTFVWARAMVRSPVVGRRAVSHTAGEQ